MAIYFGYLNRDDDSPFTRFLYVNANSDEDARQKIEATLRVQNRTSILDEWTKFGKPVGIKQVSSEYS